ncbi:MAG: sugar phosphate isomerase/epimerase, partial [Fuerstiella sp.]
MRRRDFLYRTSALVAAAAAPNRLLAANSGDSTRIPLGLDAHSMRGMKWKATQLIEFAAEQRLDAVLLNSLNYFESLEESHLLKLKQLADGHNLRIYMGAGGICENGAKFSDKWGNAESMLATGIRVATTIGSPVVNVRIGSIDDRFLKGGIQPRIDEAVRVLKAAGKRAEDAQKTRRRR